jgi:hypothetical protein
MVTVDGTDFRVGVRKGQGEEGKSFYSYKFKAGGLRYEVALNIRNGYIVWVNGPFPPGFMNDIMIFRTALIDMLAANERVEADDGYLGEAPRYVKCSKSFTNDEACLEMQREVRNRHEKVNKRFKHWGWVVCYSAFGTTLRSTVNAFMPLLLSLNLVLRTESPCHRYSM